MRRFATRLARWFIGPFYNRRLTVFWLVSAFALGGVPAWLTYRSAEKAAEEDSAFPLLGPAPSCDVLEIHDGDTMKLDCGWQEDKPQIVTVRLYCIDAPEIEQEPWGRMARDHLRKITATAVAIKPVEWDRHRRLVAIVYSKGSELNLRMVSDGSAAVYTKYCPVRTYYDAQSGAQTRAIGIWSRPGAQQKPWEWRHGASS